MWKNVEQPRKVTQLWVRILRCSSRSRLWRRNEHWTSHRGGGTLFWKERVSITQWEWVCVGVFVFDTRVKLKLRTKRSSFHQFYPQSSANHSGVQQRCVSEAEFKGCAFLRHTRSSREGARRGERRGSEVQRDFVKQRGDKNVSPRLLRYLPHGGAAEHGRLPHSLRYGRNRLKK